MATVISEFINSVSNPDISISNLLRSALVIARRLEVSDFVNWICLELNGYGEAELPAYRKIVGTAKLVPIDGVSEIIIKIPPNKLDGLKRVMEVAQIPLSVPLIEEAAATKKDVLFYPPSFEIMSLFGNGDMGNFTFHVYFSPAHYKGILEAVRNEILEWALKLEKLGVDGGNIPFLSKESAVIQHIGNYINVRGNVESQIQIDSNGSTQNNAQTTDVDLESLKGLINAMELALERFEGADADELRAELGTLKSQANSPRPKWSIIKSTAESIKNITEGAAGSVLAGLAPQYMNVLQALATT